MKRLLLIAFSLLLTLTIISYGDNSTGTDPEPEPENEPDTEVTTGTLEVTTSTQGEDIDPDGYTVTVDGSEHSIGTDETVTIEELEEGSYEAELSGIAENCTVGGDNPRSVDVVAEDITGITFDISCESESSGDLPSELKDKIVFQSGREGNYDIFVMDADGSNQQRLTDNSDLDISPVVSNDGTKIAFVSRRDETINIYTMDADGTNIQQVTEEYYKPSFPHLSWSPDDSKIVFYDKRSGKDDEVYGDEGYYNELYTINPDGSNLTRLTNNDAFDGFPDWSPDGNKIVFTSKRDGGINSGQDIYTMNTDGSDLQRLTDDESTNSEPRWSPGGSQIIFHTNRDASDSGTGFNNINIYMMGTDGSGVQQLTDYTGADSEPAWSPDGTEIVFVTNRDSNTEIYKMNADGSGTPVNLSNNGGITFSGEDGAPYWSPVE